MFLSRLRLMMVLCLCIICSSELFSSTTVAHASPHPHRPTISNSSTPELESKRREAEARWFQLSHYGSPLPRRDALLNARQQAKRIKRFTNSILVGKNSVLSPGSWSELGPAPVHFTYGANTGRITAIAVDPTNSNIVWIGAADGGVWKSITGGQIWQSMTNYTSSLSIGSIAIDPTNTQIVYVGTGEGNYAFDDYWGAGILKTTDGGQTWSQYDFNQFGGLSINHIVIDPTNTNNLLISVSLPKESSIGIGGLPPGVPATNVGIWRSTDSGQLWTHVFSVGAATDLLFDPLRPTVLYAGIAHAGDADGVWESTSSGTANSWNQITTPPLPTGNYMRRVTLAISHDGSRFYALMTDVNDDILNGVIYRSDHYGATWTAITLPNDIVKDSGENQWSYDATIAIDPTDNQRVYIGGVYLWESQDDGVTWSIAGLYQGVHTDQHAITFLSNSSTMFYVGNDGGIWQGNFDSSYSNLNGGGLDLTQFYSGSIGLVGSYSQLWGGSQDNGTITDQSSPPIGLSAWSEDKGGDGGTTVVDYTNNAIIYGENPVPTPVLYKNTSGGSETGWSQITAGIDGCTSSSSGPCIADPANQIIPLVMDPTNHNQLYVGTDRVYVTTNGGTSWSNLSGQSLTGGTPLSAIAVSASNHNYIYAGNNGGSIYLSTDGGHTWHSTAIPAGTGGMVTSLAVDPANSSVVYATYSGFASCNTCGQHVFKSINAGTSWTDIDGTGSNSLPNVPFDTVIVSPLDSNIIIVGSDTGVFVSSDGGTTWYSLIGLPNVAVDQLFLDPTGVNLYAATHGRGMWKIPLITGTVYLGTTGKSLQAISAANGSSQWSYQTGGIVGSPAVANGLVYAPSGDGKMYAIETTSHNLIWSYQAGVNQNNVPTIANGVAYFGGSGGLYAVNANSGALIWFNALDRNDFFQQQPAVSNGVVYIGGDNAKMYAVNASTGALIWSHQLDSVQDQDAPVVSGGVLYTGTVDGSFYALNTSTGVPVWTYKPPSCAPYDCNVYSQGALVSGVVYFSNNHLQVYALNASNGTLIWVTPANVAGSTPIVQNNTLIMNGVYGVSALSITNGSVIWNAEPTAIVRGESAVANGIVYFGDANNNFYAVNARTGGVIWSVGLGTINTWKPAVGP